MADQEEKKDPDKGAEDKKPPMQEGAPRSVAEIEADLVKAALAQQPTDDLVKELIAAKIAEQATGDRDSAPPPPVPAPQMGMPQEESYARKMADERKEAIEAIIEANPHLSDPQKAMARQMGTVKAARELVATYPRPSSSEVPKMGLQGRPSEQGAPAKRVITGGLPGNEAKAMARQMGVREVTAKGPHIDESTKRFVLGHMGPAQFREKTAKGWDPRAEFPATVEG